MLLHHPAGAGSLKYLPRELDSLLCVGQKQKGLLVVHGLNTSQVRAFLFLSLLEPDEVFLLSFKSTAALVLC